MSSDESARRATDLINQLRAEHEAEKRAKPPEPGMQSFRATHWQFRRRVAAALWVMGASWHVLGKVYGTGSGNVHRQGTVELEKAYDARELVEMKQRRVRTGKASALSFDVVATYVRGAMDSPEQLERLSVQELMMWLRTNVTLDTE